MRLVVSIAAILLLATVTCGPDPNAVLPGMAKPISVTGTGGTITGTGGATTVTGTGGNLSPFGSGGTTTVNGTGGNSSPFSNGGTTTIPSGTGGSTPSGTGGTTSSLGTGGDTGGGGSTGGTEPCTPAATITGTGSGNSGNFGTTGAYCFRTPDNISGWGCSNLTGRTLKVNNVTETCGALPLPAKIDGFYYFDSSAGSVDYASIYWY